MADVTYTDSWEEGLFAREAKLAWLDEGADIGKRRGGIPVVRGALDDFKPEPFQAHRWPSLAECFAFKSSGVETTRDHLVYDLTTQRLREKLEEFHAADHVEALSTFSTSRRNDMTAAKSRPYDDRLVRRVAYRPLDRRYLFNVQAYVDWPRPDLQAVWGKDNYCLSAMPFATAAGPAVWCHGLLPDRHAFRGSYGGYAFPIYDRRPGRGPVNLSSELVQHLALAYASPVTPEAAFDATLALLSATSYTLRFAEDLEDVFPHVPFPADHAVFEQAAEIGTAIREVETFSRSPAAAYIPSTLARFETTPHGPLTAIGPGDWEGGELILCDNGSGKVSGIPAAVWEFAVSGYRVLPRWLAARKGVDVDDGFIKEFRDINGRINEIIHRFEEADLVLEQALNHSLTRDRLGLAPAAREDEDERP